MQEFWNSCRIILVFFLYLLVDPISTLSSPDPFLYSPKKKTHTAVLATVPQFSEGKNSCSKNCSQLAASGLNFATCQMFVKSEKKILSLCGFALLSLFSGVYYRLYHRYFLNRFSLDLGAIFFFEQIRIKCEVMTRIDGDRNRFFLPLRKVGRK